MTEQDEKNIQILSRMFEQNFELSDSSIKFAQNWLRNPKVDKLYEKYLGDDFRMRWDIPLKNSAKSSMAEKDEAYETFKSLFNIFLSSVSVSYEDFVNNVVNINKNDVKLSKAIIQFFCDNKEKFIAQLKANSSFEKVYSGLSVTIEQVATTVSGFSEDAKKEEITRYVTRANEIIGRLKKSKGEVGYQIVLSLNFADWMLASTANSFTSCISLESSHGYWYGIPFMLDDMNRGFLYVTKKVPEKKEYLGLVVDKVLCREWSFLSKDNTIHGFRWYPGGNKFMDESEMSPITGLSMSSRSFELSKYPIGENIHSKFGKAFCTPYLDSIGVTTKEGKYFYSCSSGSGGARAYGSSDEISKVQAGSGSSGGFYPRSFLKKAHKLGLGVYEATKWEVCDECGEKAKKGSVSYSSVMSDDGSSTLTLCRKCLEKSYFRCPSCGNLCRKSQIKKTADFKDGICQQCYTEKYTKCTSCGEFSLKDKMKDNLICPKCFVDDSKTAMDTYSGERVVRKLAFIAREEEKDMFFFNKENFDFYCEEAEVKKGIYIPCAECGVFHKVPLLEYDFHGSAFCKKCLDKLSLKNQLWFDFGTTGGRKKKKKENAEKPKEPVVEMAPR